VAQRRPDALWPTSFTNAVHDSGTKVIDGPAGTLESRTEIACTTGDLTSTHAPFPVEYEDFVHVFVAP
jgi:hypothetical protein